MQRLTYNELPNKGVGLYIDDNDKLYLFYLEGIRDTITGFVYDYRILYITNEKGAEWSQPEVIETPVPIFGQNRRGGLWMDIKTKIIHILYSTYAGDLYDDTLYYTNSTIPDWEVVKIDSLPGAQNDAWYRSLNMDFDTLGNVHLTWHVEYGSTGVNWYRLMYANNSTGEWVKQQVSPPIFLGGMGSGPSYLTVQKNGIAHIVYNGEVAPDYLYLGYYVRNDSLNSTNWIADTIPRPSRPLWYYAAGPIKVDVNDRVHLITGGCIAEDCVWPGLTRTFYWYKQIEDSIWQGPEQIPDTAFGSLVGIEQLLIDEDGIPYASYFFSSNEVYFTDRKQGSWEVPYGLVGWHGQTPDSFMVDNFCFVLDSQAKGHGAFSAFNFAQGMLEDDSVEIYYVSSSSSDIEGEEENHKISHFNLIQNYPNPFNSSTIISYEIGKAEQVSLKIYDILGREVRSLVNGLQRPGVYRLIWDGKNNQGKEVTSGIYFYQLKTGNFSETKKLVLIK